MSMQHPNVVYVGDLDAGRHLLNVVRPLSWSIYLPSETYEALAITVLYMPDAVIFDHSARPIMAAEVYYHLRTLTGNCPPIISLTRDAHGPSWADPQHYLMPPRLEPPQLIAAVRTVVERGESVWR
jgi:hypothetical protein